MRRRVAVIIAMFVALVVGGAIVRAHSGPPFPIVSGQVVGAYKISIWADPDTTDDRTAAGQFWIVLETTDVKSRVPADTKVQVEIRPLDTAGPAQADMAEPVNGAIDRQFVALLMDHEGPFGVHVIVTGALGRAEVDSKVDATYDTRPPVGMIAVYVFPFLAIGALWAKVLLRRRRLVPPPT
jgi:hypothetical protein